MDSANKIPDDAHMANRPLAISFIARSSADAFVLPIFKGLKPKNPGGRSEPGPLAIPIHVITVVQNT